LDPLPTTRIETKEAAADAVAVWSASGNEGLVYDLRRSESGSDGYYVAVSEFADALLAGIELRAGTQLASYRRYVLEDLCEAERSHGEYALDLLTLGLALTRYAGAVQHTPGWVVILSQEIFWLHWESSRLKPVANLVQALLSRYFLAPNIACRLSPKRYEPEKMPQLIDWLQAAGEFEQEIRRLNNWHSYLDTLDHEASCHTMEIAAEVFLWFTSQADRALGAYTRGVSHFLITEHAHRGFRRDHFFCAKAPVEYHLAMLACEIMNRGLHKDFESAPHKAVLLPACLRGAHAQNCQAREFANQLTCAACDPDCTVNRITRQMRDLKVKVYMAPPAIGFNRCLERGQHEPDTGVIAVACLAKILPVGYQMRARRIPAQCLPLDFPGCQDHWCHERIATELNEKKLEQLFSGLQGSCKVETPQPSK
jgi:hypothetical protein